MLIKKQQTIQRKVLKVNITIIIVIMLLTTVVFNVAMNIFITKTIANQLTYIVNKTAYIAKKEGEQIIKKSKEPPREEKPSGKPSELEDQQDMSLYFMLDRSLRDSLSVINADYMLLDENYDLIDTYPYDYFYTYKTYLGDINALILEEKPIISSMDEQLFKEFKYQSHKYIAVIKPVIIENSRTYLVVFASMEQMEAIQLGINLILVFISFFMMIVGFFMSIMSAKKISKPFSLINSHIRNMAHRNFGTEIEVPIVDELKEFVENINYLSEQLSQQEESQKVFFQNISHDLRTPLMTISGYAEAIMYDVLEPKESAKIILNESQKMKKMVEEIMFISRLETDLDLPCEWLDITELIVERIKVNEPLALDRKLLLELEKSNEVCLLFCNRESMIRCFENLLQNAMRYARTKIQCKVMVSENSISLLLHDDGPGFDEELFDQLFERFKKGNEGHIGLGLAIVKGIVVKCHGSIKAYNDHGATIHMEFPKGKML